MRDVPDFFFFLKPLVKFSSKTFLNKVTLSETKTILKKEKTNKNKLRIS